MNGESAEPANEPQESAGVQGLLRAGLEEEEQRLNSLEERVQRLTERRTRGKLKQRLAAGKETRQHTSKLSIDVPASNPLAEMLDDVEDQAGASLADLVESENAGLAAPVLEDSSGTEAGFRETASAPAAQGPTTDDFRETETDLPSPDGLEAPRPRGLRARGGGYGASEDDEASRRRAFRGPAPELLDDALAALTAPKPRGFRDDDSEESEGFREPLPLLPPASLEAPKPRGLVSETEETEELRPAELLMPPDILEAPQPSGFRHKSPTETDRVVSDLEVGDEIVDEDAADDLYQGAELEIPDDDQSDDAGLPLPSKAAEPPGFAELTVDTVPEVWAQPERDDDDRAETLAARKLIAETAAQLQALERELLERRTRAAAAPAPAPTPKPDPEGTPSATKFGLERAFGSAAADLTRVLDGQQRLLDQVEALSAEIDEIRTERAAPPEETQALNVRVERAEAAAGEAWRHVAESTERTEKLVHLVERIVERVGRLEERPAPAPPPPPQRAVDPASADASTTQALIRMLQSGVVPRQDFSISGAIPRLEGSGRVDRPRDLLMATIQEHQELLKDQGRLLERLIKLQERTS